MQKFGATLAPILQKFGSHRRADLAEVRRELGREVVDDMAGHADVNRALWDELAPLHAASEHYDVGSFLRTRDSLGEIEVRELGEVRGATMAHLMCHIGLDTLSWVRRGADVTGLDFSGTALDIARDLAARTGLAARFVRGDVAAAADLLGKTYDIVFLSRGVLMWVADIAGWARVCARLLRPGGTFYLLDLHPLSLVLERMGGQVTVHGDYFSATRPTVVHADGSYAVPDAVLDNKESHEWVHGVGEVLSALVDAGIEVEFLHEHPDDGRGGPGPRDPDADRLPGLYSIRGHKPA